MAETKPKKKALPFEFHPFEIAFAGFSNAGKSTLIQKLLNQWPEHKIGYLKHDAHRFAMDKPGKDTHEAFAAGAHKIFINDPEHFAQISRGQPSQNFTYQSFVDCDFLLLEGYKNSALPKVLVLDEACKILEEGPFSNVLCTVSAHAQNPRPELPHPWFHRDNVVEISAFLMKQLLKRAPKIKGLVLGGGFSKRMGADKNFLQLGGQSLRDRAMELLKPFCDEVYWSVRNENQSLEKLPVIPDQFLGIGPLGGILSAQKMDPRSAWLVLACDLPAVSKELIAHLLQNRNPFKIATAFLSEYVDKPEPLCALWEPLSYTLGLQGIARGFGCPRYVLGEGNAQLLQNPFPGSLDNANTPEDFQRITGQQQ